MLPLLLRLLLRRLQLFLLLLLWLRLVLLLRLRLLLLLLRFLLLLRLFLLLLTGRLWLWPNNFFIIVRILTRLRRARLRLRAGDLRDHQHRRHQQRERADIRPLHYPYRIFTN